MSDWYEVDPRGLTVLHVAAIRGHRQCVEVLIDKGCPASVRDAHGWTPLDQVIASCGSEEVEGLLTDLERRRDREKDGSDSFPDCKMRISVVAGPDLRENIYVYKRGSDLRLDFPRRLLWVSESLGLGGLGDDAVVFEERNEDLPADLLSFLVYDGPEEETKSFFERKRKEAHLVDRSKKLILWSRTTAKSNPTRRRVTLVDRRFHKIRNCLARTDAAKRVCGLDTARFDAKLKIDNRSGLRPRPLSKGPLKCTWSEYLDGYRERRWSTDDLDLQKIKDQTPPNKTTPCQATTPPQRKKLPGELKIRLFCPPKQHPLNALSILSLLRLAADDDDAHSPLRKLANFVDRYLGRHEIDGAAPIRIEVLAPGNLKFLFTLRDFQRLTNNKDQEAYSSSSPPENNNNNSHHTSVDTNTLSIPKKTTKKRRTLLFWRRPTRTPSGGKTKTTSSDQEQDLAPLATLSSRDFRLPPDFSRRCWAPTTKIGPSSASSGPPT